ncbi:MAG TPA: hypothetical protein VH475_08210 [Tepidisphaeraceae bacterium]
MTDDLFPHDFTLDERKVFSEILLLAGFMNHANPNADFVKMLEGATAVYRWEHPEHAEIIRTRLPVLIAFLNAGGNRI